MLVACIMVPMMKPADVQAAVKINSTKHTMYIGDTYTLKVTGTSKTVKWSSSRKSVAAVTQKGKVSAKAEGNATITAKYGRKKLTCKITVKSRSSSKDVVKNIAYELFDIGDGVVAILKNNNDVTISVSAKLVYYKDGKMIDTSSDSNYCFEKGRECALYFYGPDDSDYNDVAYDDYKLTLSVEKTNRLCGAAGIDVKADFGADNVTTEVTNNSGYDLDSIIVACVFYDSAGQIIGYEDRYAHCESGGSVDYLTFDFPYDRRYNTIYPDSYKIYVNCAYAYSW